jgi:hypothetical protein
MSALGHIAVGAEAKQEAARTLVATTKRKIAALERDRRAVLLGDSDIEAVLAIDDRIVHHRRIIAACQDRITALSYPLSGEEQSALGLDVKYHPVTGLLLQDGVGAWSPDRQARELHLPIIEKTEGKAVAAAMLRKLDTAA